jgi:hypothetical protein
MGCGVVWSWWRAEAPRRPRPVSCGPGAATGQPSAALAEARRLAAPDQVCALSRTPGQVITVHAARLSEESERLWAEAARADPSWAWPFYDFACWLRSRRAQRPRSAMRSST